MKRTALLLYMMFVTVLVAFAQIGTFINVKDFGAVGDGLVLDTKAINQAIDAADKKGGGTVFFPAGTYRAYSIHLKSNITLYLDNGCTLLAADYVEGQPGYDHHEDTNWNTYQDFGHSYFQNSLIWGENLHDVAIVGQGFIHGKGLSRGESQQQGIGNKAIALKLCRNVTIKDISIVMGGHFAILATGTDLLTLDNLKVDTNRDAFDIDCCQHVRISNCTVNSPWDDAICLKSSFALGYARTTEDVTVTNCYVSGFDRQSLLNGTYTKNEANTVPDKGVVTGRIKLGTESNGGFRNIVVSNCTFEFCRGLALETVDGGILEDVSINNITMKEIQNAPFFLRLGSRMRGPQGTPVGAMRRINISNIVVDSQNPDFCSMVMGIPGHDIEDVVFSNIIIRIKGGAQKLRPLVAVPENETSYPDPQEFGPMPAYGFYVRHAKGVRFNNVQLLLENPDGRPAFVFDDVKGAVLKDVMVLGRNKAKTISKVNFKAVKYIH
jgi:polygalacturonase